MVNPLYGTIVGTEVSVDLESFRWTNKTGHVVTVTRNADIRVIHEDGPGGRVVVGSPSVDPNAPTQPPGGAQDSHATPVSEADQVRKVQAARITRLEVVQQTVTTTHTPTNWSKNISAEAVANIQKALKVSPR